MKKISLLFVAMFALMGVNMHADLPATGAQGYMFNKTSKLFWGGENGTIVTGDFTGCLITIANEGLSENGGARIKGNANEKDMPGHTFTYLRFYPDGTGTDYRMRFGNDGLHWGAKPLGFNKWACEETSKGILVCLIYKPGDGYGNAGDPGDMQGWWLTSTGMGGQVTPVAEPTENSYWEWIPYNSEDPSGYYAKVAESLKANKDAVLALKLSATVRSAAESAINTFSASPTDENMAAAKTAVNAALASVKAYAAVKEALDAAETTAASFAGPSKTYYDANIGTFVTAYENGTIEGDGSNEIAGINAVVAQAIAKDLKPGDDATSVIANPQFNDGISGWSGNFGNGKQKGDPTNYVVTNYGAQSDVYQSLEGMKPGYYKLEVQAYTRLQTSDRKIADGGWDWHWLLQGKELDNYASIYANGVEKKVHSITDNVYDAAGPNASKWQQIEGETWYVPYNAQATSDVFTYGDYDNYLYCKVESDGKLTLGVKNTDTSGSAYIAFDNFRLTYLGDAIPEETVTLAVTDAKYATFIAPFDVVVPSGVEAYRVTGVKEDGVNLDMVKVTTISANTPVVLYAESAVSVDVKGVNTATDLICTDGLLRGVYCEKHIPAGTGYVLQNQAGNVKFYQTDNTKTLMTVPANHAYVYYVPAGGGEVKSLGFDAIATAIQNLKAAEAAQQGGIYNLNGQQLNGLQRGINIVGGKKVFVK